MSENKVSDSLLVLKNKIKRNRKTTMTVLYVILAISLIFHAGYSFIFIVATDRILPDGFSLLYTTWKTSHDIFVGMPNFFVMPLVLILFLKLSYKLRGD